MAIQKANQVLPEETAQALLESKSNKQAFRANIQALCQAGWTAVAVSNALGMTRERVRQIMNYDLDVNPSISIPSPPEKIEREKTSRREVLTPDPDVLERLLELKPIAQSVRFAHRQGRQETEEYTRLLADEVNRGVSVYQLAKALGVTNNAIRFRLVRYGYLEPTETVAKNHPHLVRRVKYRASV